MSDVPLRDYIDIRFEQLEKEIALQHTEYLRRLDQLNGEAERLRDIQATYVPRETYDNAVDAWHVWREGIDRQLISQNAINTEQTRLAATSQPWQIWAAGAVLAILIIGVNLLTA